ncbi:hypothetical protein BDN72DRAFT_898958 [Pluteus cervinus]|uniref:Uncharacterized protein n=1 Tax=Pluteus cervinus TaxID=181527 RepID=A0ACD3ANA6_9AGAR|nr:hypothetical protein BDN72DRAFT_898958 [Pluteus cervinus]
MSLTFRRLSAADDPIYPTYSKQDPLLFLLPPKTSYPLGQPQLALTPPLLIQCPILQRHSSQLF